MKIAEEVKLTKQHQITIPKKVCAALNLTGGDRLEIIVSGKTLTMKPKRLIDSDDEAYLLGKEILEAEKQLSRGETVSWSEIKRQHQL